MKIGILHQAVGRHGGAERVCLDVTRNLAHRGHEVVLFWHDWGSEKDPRSIIGDCGKEHVRVWPVPWRTYHLHRLKEMMCQCDVLFTMYHVNPRVGWLISRLLKDRVPLVWYGGEPNRGLWEKWITTPEQVEEMKSIFHSTVSKIYGRYAADFASAPIFYPLTTGFLRLMDYTYVKRFNMVIGQSQCAMDTLSRIYRLPSQQLHLVYPGVDDEHFEIPEEKAVVRATEQVRKIIKTNYFLTVGALQSNKNHEQMFRAFIQAIHDSGRDDFSLVTVGDGPLLGQLRTMALDAGTRVDIHVLGQLPDEDLSLLYRHCRALLHAAFWEPFGLTPIEAALYGRPSIVPKIGGTAETVIHNQTGLHINPYDTNTITHALHMMMSDKTMADAMGKRAREEMLSRFTLNTMCDKLELLLTRYVLC